LARFLALDWDHKQLHLVAATLRGGVVRIEKALCLREEHVPNPAEAEELGKLLRQRLKEAGITPAPVLACIGRDRVILKDLRYPAVPESEEPAVVRFQAVKELTEPPDEVVLDYATVGNGNSERRALALIARRELVNAYQALCKAAGLKLVALTPRLFGVAACLEKLMGATALTPAPEPPEAAVALLTLGENWGEFGVMREGELSFARCVSQGPGLAGEVRRNIAVYGGQVPQHPVRAVYVAGGSEYAALREQLRDMLDVPVHSFDPFAGVERPDLPLAGRGAFAGAVGLLHTQAGRDEFAINFIKPRQPRVQSDPNQRRLVLGGALAASLLLGAGVFCYMQLSAMDHQITAQVMRNAEYDRTLGTLEEDAKKFKALHEWDGKSLDVLDELYDVVEKFPDPQSIQLTKFIVNPSETKDKFVAKILFEGIVSDEKLANQLVDSLRADDHRRFDAAKTEPNIRGVNFFNFRTRFTTTADIAKVPPDKFTGRLPDPPAKNQAVEGADQ
jgi:Tfp pilus assembly PilM family ATPase